MKAKKTRTKRKSSAWLMKNSELTSYVIRYGAVEGRQPDDYQETIDRLQKELDELDR